MESFRVVGCALQRNLPTLYSGGDGNQGSQCLQQKYSHFITVQITSEPTCVCVFVCIVDHSKIVVNQNFVEY